MHVSCSRYTIQGMSHGRALVGVFQQCSHTTDTADPSHHRDIPRRGHDQGYSLVWVDGT